MKLNMSSCRVLRESNVRVNSPAKLFDRMKSRVQKEGLDRTPAKHFNFSDELRENSSAYRVEAEAITLSPIASPTKPGEPNFSRFDMPPFSSGLCGTPRNRKTSRLYMESTAVSCHDTTRSDPVRHLICSTETNRTSRTSVEGQNLTDVSSPLWRRKRKLDVNNKNVFRDGASPPKERRTEPKYDPVQEAKHHSAADRLAEMSPIKVLAYLRHTDSRIKQGVPKNSSGETLRPPDKARGLTPSPVDYNSYTSASDGVSEVTQSVPAGSPSVPESHEEPLPPLQQVVLIEDPLVVHSPKLVIPKKRNVLTQKKCLPHTTFPSESEIYLSKWLPRKNRKGLFVDGLRREDTSPWNSNTVVERVSNFVLKTVSGRVYILCGKMSTDRKSELPRWFLKKFSAGFPPDWKELLVKLKEDDGTDGMSRTFNLSKAAVNKKPDKPNKSKLTSLDPSPSTSASSKVSRSGRVIRPPLEYWKGGRVTVDAQMNVTIFECYDKPTTPLSSETSHRPQEFLPPDQENKQKDSPRDHSASVQLRKTRPPPQRRHKATSEQIDKPSSSSGLRSGLQRQSAVSGGLTDDTQSQSEPEKPKSRGSKNPTGGAKKAQRKPMRRTQTIFSSSEDQTEGDLTDPDTSDEDFIVKRKRPVNGVTKRCGQMSSESSQLPTGNGNKTSKSKGRKNNVAKPQRPKKTNKKPKVGKDKMPPQSDDAEEWTRAEMLRLQQAVSSFPKHVAGYWAKVAAMVGSRTAEECHNKQFSYTETQTTATKPKKGKKEKVETTKETGAGQPVITARPGTFRRKQQVRQFLENMPTDDMDDVFSCDFMQKKKFKLPSMPNANDLSFNLNNLEPTTPNSSNYPEVKTPQCLYLTPGMFGSPSRNLDDKYVFQLQKRMKKKQFSIHKPCAKNFSPLPSDKKQMRRCANTENETFVVWEMFPEKDNADSSVQEDFYFSDSD